MKKFGCFMSAVVAIAAVITYIVYNNNKVSERKFLEKIEQEAKEKLYKAGKATILEKHNAIILDAELCSKIFRDYVTKEMDFVDTLLYKHIYAEPVFLEPIFELKSDNKIILNILSQEDIIFRLQKSGQYFKFKDIRFSKDVYLSMVLYSYKFDDGLEFSGVCSIIDRAFFEPYFKGKLPKWKNYKEYENAKEDDGIPDLSAD